MKLETLAALQKVWPELDLMVASPKLRLQELSVTWLDLASIIEVIVGDFQLVLENPRLGFQTAQKVPQEAIAAFEALVRRGYTSRLIAKR